MLFPRIKVEEEFSFFTDKLPFSKPERVRLVCRKLKVASLLVGEPR